MSTTGSYTSSNTATGTIFTVQPARASIALITICGVGALIFFFGSVKTLLANKEGGIALAFFAFAAVLAWNVRRAQSGRQTQQISVTTEGISTATEKIRTSDLADIAIIDPTSGDAVIANWSPVVATGGIDAATINAFSGIMEASAALGARQAVRNAAVVARRRGSSGHIPLAVGLTVDVALNLVEDLGHAVERAALTA